MINVTISMKACSSILLLSINNLSQTWNVTLLTNEYITFGTTITHCTFTNYKDLK